VCRIDRRQARAVIPIFIDEVKEPDTRVRWHGLYYLRKLAPDAKDAIPVPLLIEAMSDPDYGVRGMAAWLLGEIGPRAAPAVPALVKALSVNDMWIRSASAPALVKILGSKGTMALPVLIEGLGEENEEALDEYLHALQTLGPAANEALPALLWLANKDRAHRNLIVETIWRISLDADAPVLLLLQDLPGSNGNAQLDAIRLLGQMGPDAKSAVPALCALCADDNAEVRLAGLEALHKVDADAWIGAMQQDRAEHVGWPWRLAAGVLILVLLGVPIGCWSCVKRSET
jgi:HEAT repeat protein